MKKKQVRAMIRSLARDANLRQSCKDVPRDRMRSSSGSAPSHICSTLVSAAASSLMFAAAFVVAFLVLEAFHRKIDYEFHDRELGLHGHRSRTTPTSPRPIPTRPSCGDNCTVPASGVGPAAVEPCDDFYSYVCGRGLPHKVKVAQVLMEGLQETMRAYRVLPTYKEYPSMFINQASFFLPNCTAVYSRNALGWDPFMDVLEDVGLGGWPASLTGNGSLAERTAKVDAALGVFPFVQVAVRNEYEDKYSIHLDTPTTILKRSQIWYTESNLTDYAMNITRMLQSLGAPKADADRIAREITKLEVRLEDAIGTRTFEPPAYRARSHEQLPVSDRWNWKPYLSRIFDGTSVSLEDGQGTFEVLAPQYLEELMQIFNDTATVYLLHYVGFRVMIQLSPLLPDEAQAFVPLSADGFVKGVSERLQGCVYLLEKAYPHGMKTFLRMSLGLYPGGGGVLRYDTRYDDQVAAIFRELRNVLQGIVKKTPWYDPVERVIVAEKLKKTRFRFFGTSQNLTPVAEYYNLDVPPFRGTRLLESFYNILINARRRYYHPYKGDKVADFDNRFHVSSLQPGFEYVQGRNMLFVPYANVAFLANVSSVIQLRHVPALGAVILRGLFQAIDERGAYVDHRARVRFWWNRDTLRRFEQIRDCYWRQYKQALEDILREDVDVVRTLDDDVADNAVIYPLYKHYMRRARKEKGVGQRTEQRFFVHYALPLCAHRSGEGFQERVAFFGDTPPKLRVNIPLRNFPPFSEAFGCRKGDPMYPTNGKCSLWIST